MPNDNVAMRADISDVRHDVVPMKRTLSATLDDTNATEGDRAGDPGDKRGVLADRRATDPGA